MLLHKATMGVLDTIWTGRYAAARTGRYPVLLKASLDLCGLDPGDWWEVPSHLVVRARRSYPWMDPVVSETGELLDLIPWPEWRIYGERPPEPDPAPKTGRRRRRRIYQQARQAPENSADEAFI